MSEISLTGQVQSKSKKRSFLLINFFFIRNFKECFQTENLEELELERLSGLKI